MEKKRIFLFGATGQTGRHALQQALEMGHKVTALARTPEKLEEFKRYENFDVKKGDSLDKSTYEDNLEGADVVMSCLGSTSVSRFSELTFFSDSIAGIHEAMKKNGIKRFIGMSSWATQDRPDLPFFLRWILRPIFLKKVLDNLNEMELYLEKTDINYTIVRPPGLTDGPKSGKEVEVIIEIDGQHVPGCTSQMPRADVATFMLKAMQGQEYDKTMLAIGIK